MGGKFYGVDLRGVPKPILTQTLPRQEKQEGGIITIIFHHNLQQHQYWLHHSFGCDAGFPSPSLLRLCNWVERRAEDGIHHPLPHPLYDHHHRSHHHNHHQHNHRHHNHHHHNHHYHFSDRSNRREGRIISHTLVLSSLYSSSHSLPITIIIIITIIMKIITLFRCLQPLGE